MAYLSTRQVQKTLNVSKQTVFRMIRAGELRAIKGAGPTSPFKIDEDSLKEYIERHTVEVSA